jgi:hypothetical protein
MVVLSGSQSSKAQIDLSQGSADAWRETIIISLVKIS